LESQRASRPQLTEAFCSRQQPQCRQHISGPIRAVDLTTTFDEEIHTSGHESVSPATILEQSEDADLIRDAMDRLPVEFREILVLRHLEGSSYNEIAEIAQLARAPGKLKASLGARMPDHRTV
jgi:RNA polymerase sigma factor (sigma-70 family)